MISSPASGPWRCPRCGSDRAAADTFCGSCATRRPAGAPAAPDSIPERSSSFPVKRALILNGIILGAVALAVLFGRGEGPGTITFQPSPWRCDGTERTWIAAIPAMHPDVAIEWRSGGPEGALRATTTTTRTALEAYQTSGGVFRVTATGSDAPECGLPPDRYTLVLRDVATNVLVASGDVELEP